VGYIKGDIINFRSQFYKNKIKLDLKTQYATKSIQSHRVSNQKNFCLNKSQILLLFFLSKKVKYY